MALHEIFPRAPLYTSVYDPVAAPWAKDFDIRTSFIQKLPLPKTAHEYYPFLMGPAFETFSFDDYDLVISVTHEFAKAIITKPKTKHICYCLTPTSYLWSGYDQYFFNKPLSKFLSKPLINYLRWYDKIICHRPDKYIAISKTVQSRIKSYYGLDSEVIFPPVGIQADRHTGKQENFFLIVSRLVPNKRIDIAVEAFNKLGLPLKIIGSGREFRSLNSLKFKNIEMLGYLTDEEVARYYEKCRAVIIPGEEDFNIVAVEAQSYGRPVIAYRAGGVTETVIEGKTGYFFDEPTAESLVRVVGGFREVRESDCIKNAQKFSKERFKREFLKYVRNT